MRKLSRILTTLGVVGAASLALAGCSQAGSPTATDGQLKIVTTTTQLDDFTKQVVGDTGAQVTTLLQPGSSVHSFEPTPADLEAIRAADVVIYNGQGLEPWLDSTLSSAEFAGTKVDASAGFDPGAAHDDHDHGTEDGHDHGTETEDAHDEHATEDDHAHDEHDHATESEQPTAGAYAMTEATASATDDHAHDEHGHDHDHGAEDGHDHDHDHGGVNPHIWTSPDNAKLMVENVKTALVTADAAHADQYEANATAYTAKLDELDAWIAENIDTVPEAERLVVTNHDALKYFNDEYHVTFVGSVMPSWDDNAEPSAAQLEELIANIKSSGVKAIFTEQQLSPETVDAIASKTGIKVYSGDQGLYTDALGAAGSDGDTYIKSQIHNTTVLMDSWGAKVTPAPADLENA